MPYYSRLFALHKIPPLMDYSCFVLIFTSIFLGSLSTYGAGFQLGEHSANAIGRALAGYGVVGDDASAVFFNPAGLVLLQRPTVQNGLFYVTGRFGFENQRSRQSLSGLSVPSRGIDDDGGRDGLAPSLYALAPLGERARVALGITAPFGLLTDYDADWVGRYHALRSELKTIDINPSFAYRVSRQLSLGAGVSVQYADATLSRAVFRGNQLADGFARVEGDDWSLGYDLGLMFEWDERTRFGAGYRSKVDHSLRGTRKLEGVPGQPSVIGGEAELNLPDTLYFGAYRRLNERLALSGGARWTHWSRFQETRIRFADGSPDELTVQNWEDSWTFSVGLDYAYHPHWTLRAGYGYDQTPVPSARFRTPRIPDNDRHWLSVGTSYRLNEKWDFSLGYSHVFVDTARIGTIVDLVPVNIAPTGTFTDTLIGEYDTPGADSIGAQLRYAF